MRLIILRIKKVKCLNETRAGRELHEKKLLIKTFEAIICFYARIAFVISQDIPSLIHPLHYNHSLAL